MTHGQVVVESEDPESATNTIIDVEKLGRQRPAVFATRWAELGFIFSLLGSMAMAVCSSFPWFFNTLHILTEK